MNDELFARVLVQLQPELAQEFGYAILEDRKKFKAFEIIKEKRVDIDLLMAFNDINIYNGFACHSGEYRRLTQEEFDLLKEVLK